MVGTHGIDRFHDERKMSYETRNENRRSLYCASSSHQKSVFADDKSKHNKPSPSITRTNFLTLALYMSPSGGSFGYRCIAVTAIQAVCVFV